MLQIKPTENGCVTLLKVFSPIETPIHAMYLSSIDRRILSTYPPLPIHIKQNTLTDIMVFTNNKTLSNVNIVYSQRGNPSPKFAQVTVNFGGRFDPEKLRWKRQRLDFNPQFTYGFTHFEDGLLALSGDLVIYRNYLYSPTDIVFSPDLFNVYTQLGTLTAELATLKDMDAPQDLIGNLEMKISQLKTTLKQMEK